MSRKCRICGCTDVTACLHDDGSLCCWADDDLCSVCDEKLLDPIFEEVVVAVMEHARSRERGMMGSLPEPSPNEADDIIHGLLDDAAGAEATCAVFEYREKMVEIAAVAIAAAKAHGAEPE